MRFIFIFIFQVVFLVVAFLEKIHVHKFFEVSSQQVFPCSKYTINELGKGLKYVQS